MTGDISALGPLLGFKSHLRAEVVSGDAVYLLSDRGTTVLDGAHVEALAPLLDGTRDMYAVVREADARVPAAATVQVLASLAEAGLVSYSARSAPAAGHDRPSLAFWELAGLPGAGAAERLSAARVRLVTTGAVDEQQARSELRSAGLPVATGAFAGECTLTVVLCDDYLDPRLADIDAEQRAAGLPWLLAKIGGSTPWIGPVFQPGAGPCWNCLAHRLRVHRQPELAVQRALGLDAPLTGPEASTAPGRSAGLQLTVLETAKWLAGYRYQGQQAVYTLDALSLEGRHHPVQRRPQCPECGDPGLLSAQVRRPVIPVSRPKLSLDGNGHRSLTPQQVMDRFGHLVSPVTGVVKSIRRDPRGPAFLNCYDSGPSAAAANAGPAAVRAGLRSRNGGKGATDLDARVSALCEALERTSGTFHGDEPRLRASLLDAGADAIHPNSCQLYADFQYRDRARWNASHHAFQAVCDPLEESTPIDWTPVWSLTAGRHRLLPTSLLYYNTPRPDGRCFARADSNGCAAGSSLEDAIVQGFLELVERDAVALWWYNRTRQPAVDLAAFDDPWVAELRRGHRDLGRETWLLDVTSDLGIPVVVALSRRTDKPAQDIVLGFGAHFDPAVAVRRALAEVNQLLPAAVAVGPDSSGYAGLAPELRDWWQSATVENQPYLLPDPGQAARTAADFPRVVRTDLRDDVAAITDLVQDRGMELLVLDQTRPDIGLPVVRVLVPGLRHFWARFGPGRLYDVPVRLGRLTSPTPPTELNPIPLFT
ncbi:TOMM precursor leader peptide-binding protein [Kitasatospora atroaurantiaca]|uniref:Ribosomal protein S12 methylthiotransferase accessory factor n=1 Tax=Kitasatospora atroaurantiaca TaxID=285545 RepID=A0A561EVG6_9ACTN|nr:TOMM precursor leader peptide-binding protein [Kitasatospora atroaurantiaca]TWE19581.1 ribosomal protein S12 methylthiotransferase accessory factor [Kitasatospora atroaurantiaca]